MLGAAALGDFAPGGDTAPVPATTAEFDCIATIQSNTTSVALTTYDSTVVLEL